MEGLTKLTSKTLESSDYSTTNRARTLIAVYVFNDKVFNALKHVKTSRRGDLNLRKRRRSRRG